jgi:hypothetical protein
MTPPRGLLCDQEAFQYLAVPHLAVRFRNQNADKYYKIAKIMPFYKTLGTAHLAACLRSVLQMLILTILLSF